MKKLLIALVILAVLGLLCAGVLGLGGGAAWFLSRSTSQAQIQAIEELRLQETLAMEVAAAEAAAAEAAAMEAAAMEAAALEAAQQEALAESEPLAEDGAPTVEADPGSAQAAAPAPRPRARPRPAPEPEPVSTGSVRVVSDDEFDEDEELDPGSMDDVLGDDDPMGDIEILDDEDPKGRRKKKNR